MEAASFSSYLVEFLSTQSAVESISYYSWDGSFFYQDNYGAQPLCQNRGAPGGREEFFHSSQNLSGISTSPRPRIQEAI